MVVVVVVGRVKTVKNTSMCVRKDSNRLFRKQKNSRKDDDENLNYLFVFSNMLIVFPEFLQSVLF